MKLKKILCLILSVILVLNIFTVIAFAAEMPVSVKVGAELQGYKNGPKIVNGRLMVPAERLAKSLGFKYSKNFVIHEYVDDYPDIVVSLQAGSPNLKVTRDSGQPEYILMTNAPFYENGELMVELRTFAEACNCIVSWNERFNMAGLIQKEIPIYTVADARNGYDTAPYATVKKVTAIDLDGNGGGETVLDEDLNTWWAELGDGVYLQFEFEKPTVIQSIEVILNPNNRRSQMFEVQISDNGEEWRTIYIGHGSRDSTGTEWEEFVFNPNIIFKPRFVRYVGRGSDQSLWNAVREVRFKTE